MVFFKALQNGPHQLSRSEAIAPNRVLRMPPRRKPIRTCFGCAFHPLLLVSRRRYTVTVSLHVIRLQVKGAGSSSLPHPKIGDNCAKIEWRLTWPTVG